MRQVIFFVAVCTLFLSSCNKHIPEANFTFDQKPYLIDQEISFENDSKYADDYLWEFGDGHTSEEENPKHSFSTPGIYSVVLLAKNTNQADAFIKRVTVQTPKTTYTITNGLDVTIDEIQSFAVQDQLIIDLNFDSEIKPGEHAREVETRHQYIYCFLYFGDDLYLTDVPFQVVVNQQNDFVITDFSNLVPWNKKNDQLLRFLDNK